MTLPRGMNYKLEIPEKLDRIFHKLSKKDKTSLKIINSKISHILENPYQFKPLRNEMVGIRRVHIGKSFVLTYEILEGEKIVRLLDYDHHDKIFKK
jgi:YafQ family addiction module toxin component